ncbi:hypothetical protein Pmani_039719 [Petrolisthes manimaculis]|uniref:Uncharacterized protein n=1 Tax=Petrolisthes manimaculis TaxID=1843537 RepID=A0AAE1NEM3_9EUCA|nr:hypothetical protein Pmani_039719 [Petrolisthes manimaculis]
MIYLFPFPSIYPPSTSTPPCHLLPYTLLVNPILPPPPVNPTLPHLHPLIHPRRQPLLGTSPPPHPTCQPHPATSSPYTTYSTDTSTSHYGTFCHKPGLITPGLSSSPVVKL